MPATTVTNRSFPLMDTCRAAAALAVLVGHAFPGVAPAVVTNIASQSGAAVQVFFGISGFLLFRPYLVSLAGGTPFPGTLRFYVRRALRIIPCYWVALTLVAAVFGPRYAPGALSGDWWLFYGFGQGYLLGGANLHGLAVAWSLGTEVGFYVLLPFVALAVKGLSRRLAWDRAAMIPIAVMLVVGPAIHVLNTIPVGPTLTELVQRTTYSLPGETNFFAIGMLLAVVSVRVSTGAGVPAVLRPLASRPRSTWLASAVVIVVAANVMTFYHPVALPLLGQLSPRVRFIGTDVLVTLFVLLALLPAALDERLGGHWSPSPPMRALDYVATISYGLYLWHLPLILWMYAHGPTEHILELPWYGAWAVTTVLGLAAATVVASASWYLVERPILRLKPRRRGDGTPAGQAAPAPAVAAGPAD
jgi:peptidoglycan/LPS O-acetylase OafA/YrhL